MSRDRVTLEQHLGEAGGLSPDAVRSIAALAAAAAELSLTISLGEELGHEVGENLGGDSQKALDVMADEAFAAALGGTGVRWYASEERETAVELDPAGSLALAIDPLDGSSNIEVNVSIGTIFSLRPAAATADESFLRPGHEQLAAGYLVYGPQTRLVLATAAGVADFVLDRQSGSFLRHRAALTIPEVSTEFAINAANYRHWPKPVRAYIDDCLSGAEGPRGKNFNMRWIASLVAETHRILVRGGIFLYPADDRLTHAKGRLRLVYECQPIAFIVARAGGAATNGVEPILDRVPESLHARTPFVFGSAEKVARVAAYHDLPDSEISPLFGQRGLFRA